MCISGCLLLTSGPAAPSSDARQTSALAASLFASSRRTAATARYLYNLAWDYCLHLKTTNTREAAWSAAASAQAFFNQVRMPAAAPGTLKEAVRPGDGAWVSRSPCHSVAKYPGECTPRIEMVSKSEPGFGYGLNWHALSLDRGEPPDSTTMLAPWCTGFGYNAAVLMGTSAFGNRQETLDRCR